MTIDQRCQEGKIPIPEFVAFGIVTAPCRTHLLDVGDYAVLAFPFGPKAGEELHAEKISELGYGGENDFMTVNGTSGPISGNVFIKIDKKGRPRLIVGDKLYTGEGSVRSAIRLWEPSGGSSFPNDLYR